MPGRLGISHERPRHTGAAVRRKERMSPKIRNTTVEVEAKGMIPRTDCSFDYYF